MDMTLNLRRMAPLVAVIAALSFISSATAQKEKKEKAPTKPGKPIVWADPGAVETLDFVAGVGGHRNAPKPPFTFIEESTTGTNPKVKVKDANGAEWTAKFGTEV